mmetsp:Transcript_46962/g.121205  ORF Transcript_46962/g.121205 Transcript_46962/m.121205 type:complete len:90 (-) Transcript_46962:14-283(-)
MFTCTSSYGELDNAAIRDAGPLNPRNTLTLDSLEKGHESSEMAIPMNENGLDDFLYLERLFWMAAVALMSNGLSVEDSNVTRGARTSIV